MRIKSEYINDCESKTTEVTVPAIYHDVNTSTYGNGRIESTTTAVEGEALKTVDNTSVFTIMIVMTFALLGLVVTKRREV